MPWECEPIQFEQLTPAASTNDYGIHVAALEWSLAEPIVISGKEDIKSQANWRGRFEPFNHQVENLITFCRRLPVTLLADDVGLGKTISAGLILAELMERKRVSRTLVVCPAILGNQWVEELGAKFGIPAVFAKGQQLDTQLNASAVPVVVTTYNTASNRLSRFRPEQFDMLILDEAHKLRNLHGSQNPPLMAQRVREALEQRIFKYVLMLTATPIQNRVWDLYSLIDLLTVAKGHRNPLGTPGEFRARFIGDAAGRRLNTSTADEFRSILRQYIVRTRREDARLIFPARHVETRRLRSSDVEHRMAALVAAHIEGLGAFVQISLSQAMMSSPQALASQLENMANGRGVIPHSVAEEARKLADANPMTSKLEGLLALVRELRQKRPQDWRLVVFTMRRETQDAIGRAMVSEGISVDFIRGGSVHANQSTVERYRAVPPKVNVIVSTDAGAEGVNLQAGNVLVNYDLPWNPMVLEQRIGRIQRLASTHEKVAIVNLVVAGSVEERVVGRLMEKLQAIAQTIGDIETILESTGQDDEDSFEEMIRKLVVDSLKGQNVEEATRLASASIQDAKSKMDTERGSIDQVFGAVSTDPRHGPQPPKLVPVQPSMRPDQFVMGALAAEGATVCPRPDDTLDVLRRGQAPERITFKPEAADEDNSAVFMGNAPKLYLPGRPPFERLVQRWLGRSEHCVRDLSTNTDAHALLAVKAWCDSVPDATFDAFTVKESKRQMTGELLCRAKAVNGVDSLEKLVRIEASRKDHGDIDSTVLADTPVLREDLSAETIFNRIAEFVTSAVGNDNDIDAFCRFYDERRRDETRMAGADERRRHRVEADFNPKVFTEVVGMRGVRYDLATTKVSFHIDREHRYDAELDLIPATRLVLRQPSRLTCSVTGRQLPEPCIATCAVSGKRCTAHLLVTSAVSGRKALPEHVVRCAVSGDNALSDEVWKSDLSGKTAIICFFQQSPISGRKGIINEEFATCQITGASVLKDEVTVSALSSQEFRHDQIGRSAVSGRVGHVSEFVNCEETDVRLAPDEAGMSAVSGKVVRADRLFRSEKAPFRAGVESEFVRCAATGKALLADEVVTSAVSGKVFDRELAAASELSQRPALAEELIRCEVSGQLLLPEETDRSAVSGKRVRRDLLRASPVGGRVGMEDEFVACQITGTHVLADELLQSEESGRQFRKDEAVTSGESGRIAHRSEMVRCCGTLVHVLRSESAVSSLSGKPYSRSLLHASEKSPDRLGLQVELITCAKSGRRLLRDEVEKSSVSQRLIDRDLLRPSARSGKLALPEEFVTCEESGNALLPEETGTCAVTCKRVDSTLLAASELSGATCLKTKLVRCEVSGKAALPNELRECEMTGKRVDPAELETCCVSGKRAVRYRFVLSDVSGAAMLPEHAVFSPFSKRACKPDEAVACAWTGSRLLPDEVSTCRLTGLTFSREHINAANEFVVLRDLLDGRQTGAEAADIIGWLARDTNGTTPNVKTARCVFSPDGSSRAICGEMRTMLGLKVRHVGLVVSERDQRRVLGRIVIGKRANGVWTAGE